MENENKSKHVDNLVEHNQILQKELNKVRSYNAYLLEN